MLDGHSAIIMSTTDDKVFTFWNHSALITFDQYTDTMRKLPPTTTYLIEILFISDIIYSRLVIRRLKIVTRLKIKIGT